MSQDERVDAYIGTSAAFAQPILKHLRRLVHAACPEAEEAMKWSSPFFLYRGRMVCAMAAFKTHCSFGLWGSAMAERLRAAGIDGADAAGSFGRITSLGDLPSEQQLAEWIRTAFLIAGEIAATPKTAKKTTPRKAGKGEATVPPDLAEAMTASPGAAEHFQALSPGCRREYVEWIEEAKRPETRRKRIGEAVGWIAEGKRLHWKYETC